jgi:hypothetical protein
MITYPSTHGVYEEGVDEICKIIHDNGGQVRCSVKTISRPFLRRQAAAARATMALSHNVDA